jgi:hypothetical protein
MDTGRHVKAEAGLLNSEKEQRPFNTEYPQNHSMRLLFSRSRNVCYQNAMVVVATNYGSDTNQVLICLVSPRNSEKCNSICNLRKSTILRAYRTKRIKLTNNKKQQS